MLLAINGLSKSYGSEPVFSEVDVRLDESDHVGLSARTVPAKARF
jgi:ATPase subunit of ABC transporter with duplicated ATPase domains